MKHRSPLVTLAAVVVFLAGLMVANYLVHPVGAEAFDPTRPATAAPAPPTASPSVTSAAPTPGYPPPSASAPASPADDERFPEKVVYAGRTTDSSVAVAVAVLGNRAAAYVCDGRSFEAWLSGQVDGEELTLRSTSGATVKAELDDGRLGGRLEAGDRSWRFELRVAEKPAGIYRAQRGGTKIGWIVLPDGSQVGLITDRGGQNSPAPELDPAQGRAELNGEPVSAEPVQGDSTV